ncbi:hypothetical protein D9M72_635710 [compost metagenome]
MTREFASGSGHAGGITFEMQAQFAQQQALVTDAVMAHATDDREDLIDDQVVGEAVADFAVGKIE